MPSVTRQKLKNFPITLAQKCWQKTKSLHKSCLLCLEESVRRRRIPKNYPNILMFYSVIVLSLSHMSIFLTIGQYYKLLITDQSLAGRAGMFGSHIMVMLHVYALTFQTYFTRYGEVWMCQAVLMLTSDDYKISKFVQISHINLRIHRFVADLGIVFAAVTSFTFMSLFLISFSILYIPPFVTCLSSIDNTLSIVFLIVVSYLNLMIRLFTFSFAININTNAFVFLMQLSSLLMQSFGTNLRRLQAIVRQKHLRMFENVEDIREYLSIDNTIVWHLLSMNRSVGRLVTMLIILMVPTSVWFTVIIIKLSESILVIFNSLIMIGAIFIIIGCTHWYLTLFIKITYRPAQYLINLVLDRRIDFHTRLKIITKIEQISSANKLGFTYTTFGLISMNSCLKVSHTLSLSLIYLI